MNRIVVATVLAIMFLMCGCSEDGVRTAMNNDSEQRNIRTLHTSKKKRVYAKNIIPRAENIGDDWIEVDKKIVSLSKAKESGSGSTAEGDYVLLQPDAEKIVSENPAVKTIARSIYSHYDVEEPVALSVTWVMSGKEIRGFTEKDLYTLNRISGFSDWILEDKGIATAVPTGDIYPGFKKSLFAVNNPVAIYLAVDGGLVEVRASGELSPTDFSAAIDAVKDGLLRNIHGENGQVRMPENTTVFWNVMQKCML